MIIDAKYLSWQVRGAASQTKRLSCHSFLCAKYPWKDTFFWPFLKTLLICLDVGFVLCISFLSVFFLKNFFSIVGKKLHNFTLIYPNHWLSNPGYGAILRLSSKDFFSVDLLKCTSFFFLEKWQNALRIGVLGVSNIYWSKINIPKYDLHFIKLKEMIK